MRKKILFISNTLCQGGAEHSLVTTLNHIDKKKYDVTVFVVQPILDLYGRLPENLRIIVGENPSHVHGLLNLILMILSKVFLSLGKQKIANRLSRVNSDVLHKRKRRAIIKKHIGNEHFDVIICNTLSTWSTEIACEIPANKRYLVYHGSNDTHRSMLEELLSKFNGVVAVSEEVKELLLSWYPGKIDNIYVIENLVEADHVKKEALKYQPISANRSEGVIISSCGRLSEEKGFNLAIDAAEILKSKGYIFKWYLIGDGVQRQALESQIVKQKLDDVVCITGMKSNPFSYIMCCDIYVQPSYEESYGRTIKEAMILGKPIVSTNTVGGRLLLKNGECGELTQIDAKSIAKGIESVIQDADKREKYASAYSYEDYESECMLYERLWEALLDA